MLFSFISNQYLNEVKSIRRIQTYEYKKDLHNTIIKFKDFDFKCLTKNDVVGFIDYQKSKENTNSTINKRIGYLKEVIKYYFNNFENQCNTFELNKIVKMAKLTECAVHKEMLNKNEMNIYIDYVLKMESNTYINSRDKIGLYLLLSTGLRLYELINLKTQEIDLFNGLITLHYTKTNEPRILPLDSYIVDLLKEHLKKYDYEYLMTSTRTYTCFTMDGLNKYLHKLFTNKIGLKISSRSLRHTFATTTLRNGMPVCDVAKIMGHKDLNTTQIYLHSDTDIIKENHSKYSPFSAYKL